MWTCVLPGEAAEALRLLSSAPTRATGSPISADQAARGDEAEAAAAADAGEAAAMAAAAALAGDLGGEILGQCGVEGSG